MTSSILERPVVLSEIFEPDLFAELCKNYADLYRIGIRVYDEKNNKVVDVKRKAGLQKYLLTFQTPRNILIEFITELKSLSPEPGQWIVRDEPLSGTRYMIAAISYEFEVLGKVVVGPYLSEDQAPKPPTGEWTRDIDMARFHALQQKHQRVREATLRRVVDSLLSSINVVCHAGYKAVLTSQIHTDAISRAYEALQEKNELLKKSNARLRDLDQMKSNFLATVSHELRTPLTSVIGYSEMLLEGLAGPLSSEQLDYVTTIFEKGESLLHLINGILDISKIEQGVHKIVRQPARPESLVAKAITSVRPQANKKQVSLLIDCPPELPNISVDIYQINQVMNNLLGNAVKFTPNSGSITITVKRHIMCACEDKNPGKKGDWLRFAVTDTGLGIPEVELVRIFDTFYQVDNSSTRVYGGAGLGLAIVKSFIKAHGGGVEVSSKVGEGSTFAFTLPVDDPTTRTDDEPHSGRPSRGP